MTQARAHNFKDARGWGLKFPQGTQVQPGEQVSKVTSKGTFPVTVGEYQGTNEYGDLLYTDGKSGNGSAPAQPAPQPAPPPAGPPAAPAPAPAPASTGPAGAGGSVKASDLVSAIESAFVQFTTGPAQIPAEQAGPLAATVAIQVGRGAVNDLPDVDPFAG